MYIKEAIESVQYTAAAAETRGQDVHYAAVQNMNIWYNPSLKTNKLAVLHANLGDALIPNLALKFGDNQIAFYYEFNIIGSAAAASYNRTSFEFS